jgi:hypothetical protein
MADVRIGDSISFAMVRTGTVLFRPFNFKKFAAIAWIATLMLVGEAGPRGSFNVPSGGGPGPGPGPGGGGGPSFDDALLWIKAHLVLIILGVVAFIIVAFAIYLVVRWLSSRGHMMMYDAVVKNSGQVGAPWREMAALGNSLFKFRILFDLFVFNMFLLVIIIGGLLAWPDIRLAIINQKYDFTGWTLSAIIFTAVGFLISSLIVWLTYGVAFGIGVPVMYIRNLAAWPAMKLAWREIVRPHPGATILYLLFRIVIGIATAIWAFMGMFILLVATCCTIACVQWIPVIGNYPLAFIALPVFVYERAFALHFVSQFGPEYQVGWAYGGERGFPVEVTGPYVPPSAAASSPAPPQSGPSDGGAGESQGGPPGV